MSGRQIAGVVCFVIAGLAFFSALNNILVRGRAFAGQPAYSVGYVVGSFIPTVLLLILGLWLYQKPKPK